MKKMILGAMALLCLASPLNAQNSMKTKEPIKQTAGRNNLGEFAPEFARLNDDILFGEVWNRQDELSLHDRSLVTIISLMSQGLTAYRDRRSAKSSPTRLSMPVGRRHGRPSALPKRYGLMTRH